MLLRINRFLNDWNSIVPCITVSSFDELNLTEFVELCLQIFKCNISINFQQQKKIV